MAGTGWVGWPDSFVEGLPGWWAMRAVLPCVSVALVEGEGQGRGLQWDGGAGDEGRDGGYSE